MPPSQKSLVVALMKLHGRTYADEIGIELSDKPAPLFQLLCASLLFSARIGADIAVSAAKALFGKGWTTPEKMAGTSWQERTETLNRSRYARYDESTSTMLGETTGLLIEKYKGDLRNLRSAAGQDPEEERKKLKEFKGIGDVGVDIFFREVQLVWEELFPFVDGRARKGAEQLGLNPDPRVLVEKVRKSDFPRLVAACVRVDLTGDYDRVTAEAE